MPAGNHSLGQRECQQGLSVRRYRRRSGAARHDQRWPARARRTFGPCAPVLVVVAVVSFVAFAGGVAVPAPAGAATDRSAPTRPAALSVTSSAPTQIGLAWAKSTDNVGVTGYYVFRGTLRRTVTTNTFLDTGLTPSTSYTYSVAAFDRAGNVSARSANLTVKTPAAPPPPPPPGLPALPALPAPPAAPSTTGGVGLSTCGSITTPGTFVLTADVVAPADTTCLDVHDTSNVTIDCRGHAITSTASTVATTIINVSNVSGFNLYNCTVNPAPAGAPNYMNEGLALAGVTGGTIQHDQFLQRTMVVLSQTSGLSFVDDTVVGIVQSDHGSANSYRWLRAGVPGFAGAAVLSLGFGDHETVQYSTLDGNGGTGPNGNFGMDNALTLQWETAATVDSNVLANVWDCDLETLGLITGAQITNNQLNHATYCGLGAWWWTSWRSNIVRNNRVDASAQMLALYRLGGLDTAHGETTVYFDHNTFDSNGFTQPTGQNGAYVDLAPADNEALAAVPLVTGANLVTGNDWSATPYPPVLLPAAMFVDGGGNRCHPSTDPRTQTVHCN